MTRILADAKAFGIQYLRSRVGMFFALAFPIILILLFGSIFSQSGSPQIPVYVQDRDATDTSRAFVAALNNTTVIAYREMQAGVDFQTYIRQNSINVAIQIPTGFEDNITRAAQGDRNATVNVTLAGDVTQSSYGIVEAALGAAETQFNFQIAGARPVIETTHIPVSVRELHYIDLFLPGIIGFTILTTPLFGMSEICANYRTRKYFLLLATTKLTKAEWLAGKVIFYVLLILASVVLMLVVGIAVFGLQATLTPLAILLILAGTLEFVSLGLVLGIFVKDAETATAIANAIGFPMMFLAGSFFSIDVMPSFLQSVARVLPLTFVNEGLRATMVLGNDGTAFVYLLVTAGFAVVFFVVAAFGLSWKSK